MSQSRPFHVLSSSDDDASNDSLPDLKTRLTSKLTNSQRPVQAPVHTISSDDDDDESSVDRREQSPEKEECLVIGSEDDILGANSDQEIFPVVVKPTSSGPITKPSMGRSVPVPMASTSKIAKDPLSNGDSSHADPFNNDLPDIQNFTLLCGGLDQEALEKIIEPVKTPAKSGPKKMRAAEIREEKDAKRREREALKLKRAQEKAEIKAQKEAERTSRRAMQPGECVKYVKVQLDRHLLELPEGSQVISHLQQAELRYEVVDAPIPYVATVVRIDPLSLQEKISEDAILLVPLKDFIELVERQIYYNGTGGLCQKCEEWRTAIGVSRLTIVITGIQTYLRGKKTNKQQDFRAAVLGEEAQPKKKRKKANPDAIDSRVNRVDIETALVMAQLDSEVNHRLMTDADKVGAFIAQVTKSLAQLPYKLEKEDFTFSWYAEGSTTNSVKVDKFGVGLPKLWRQQLEQFNLVGPEVAQAITREYPSPQALIQAYRHASSEKEARHLLSDIPVRRGIGPLTSTRRIGPELSRKIHLFFTCTDPDMNLGQKS